MARRQSTASGFADRCHSRVEEAPVRIAELDDCVDAEEGAEEEPQIVGNSSAMKELVGKVARVASKDVTVLVRGETGTGKELIASLLHARSARAHAPLVRFNCAAISADLADAELFGHSRGAFTGAHQAREGFFQVANGGTVVLDEIGEMPMPIQSKLLRILQNGEIQKVGASRTERVDVRVIACTNRDLLAEARQGRFRIDLYYRLAVVELGVPPLREHREDIPALAAEFARRCSRRFGGDEVRLSPELLEALQQQDWPGNVRELENAVVRMVAFNVGRDEIGLEALSGDGVRSASAGGGRVLDRGRNLREQVDALERSIIARTLAAVAGNQSEAARRLGVSRTSLIERLKRYGLLRRAEDHQSTLFHRANDYEVATARDYPEA
jgi:transcriptional regulator with GAF, ATPase, and Fis domain